MFIHYKSPFESVVNTLLVYDKPGDCNLDICIFPAEHTELRSFVQYLFKLVPIAKNWATFAVYAGKLEDDKAVQLPVPSR